MCPKLVTSVFNQNFKIVNEEGILPSFSSATLEKGSVYFALSAPLIFPVFSCHL